MATLTIRNLDDALKGRLRVRAALRNRSMEEEARQIIRAALQEPVSAPSALSTRIRARFAPLGDVRLQVDAREAVRLLALPESEPGSVPSPSKKSAGRRR